MNEPQSANFTYESTPVPEAKSDIDGLLVLAKTLFKEGPFDLDRASSDLSILLTEKQLQDLIEKDRVTALIDTICAVNVGVEHGVDPATLLPQDILNMMLTITGRNAEYESGDPLMKYILISSVMHDLKLLETTVTNNPKDQVLVNAFIQSVTESMATRSIPSASREAGKLDPFSPDKFVFIPGETVPLRLIFERGSLQVPVRFPFGLYEKHSSATARHGRNLYLCSSVPSPKVPGRNLEYAVNWLLMQCAANAVLSRYVDHAPLPNESFYPTNQPVEVNGSDIGKWNGKTSSNVRIVNMVPRIQKSGFWGHENDLDELGFLLQGKIRNLFEVAATNPEIRDRLNNRSHQIEQYRRRETRSSDGPTIQFSIF